MPIKLPTIKELLDSGVHFGHLRARSHPKAREFAFEIRDKVIVINLDKTLERLKVAAEYCKQTASQGQVMLFVGTKKQAQDIVEIAAKQVEMPYVTTKWLAGMLTNFDELNRNLNKLEHLDALLADESAQNTKRERVKMQVKADKLHRILDGVVKMKQLPDVLVVVDAFHERIAVDEAHRLGIPVVALADTNVNPDTIDYPIPTNDDSRQAIERILAILTSAIAEGKSKIKPTKDEQKTK